MRIKVEDLILLKHIKGILLKYKESEAASRLDNLIKSLENKQTKEREANRIRSAKYRKKGDI